MKETREQESAPYIIVYCENPIPYDPILYLVVKNIGKSIAEDVKLDFTPRLCSPSSGNDFDINNMEFISKGIESMPPDYAIITLLGGSAAYFKHEEFPRKYTVRITYANSITKKKIETSQIIDLLAMEKLEYVRKKDLDDLVDKMDQITEAINNLKKK